MRAIVDAALARKRATMGILIVLLIAGYGAMVAIPKESEPDVQIPIVYVSMSQRGISPADSERLLVRPMENQLRSVEGVKKIDSTAYRGGGNVVLEFDAGHDIDAALDDVRIERDKIAPDLPEDADEPTVNEVNLSLFPVITVTLSSSLSDRAMRSLALDLKDSVEALPNVLEANIFGTLPEVVEVTLDPAKMESYGIEAGNVLRVISGNNVAISAGSLDTGAGRFAVEVPGLYENAEDVLALPLLANGDRLVTVGDIASVRATFREPESFARVNGQRAVSMEVSKRLGTNIIETIDQVKQTVERESGTWPPGVSFAYNSDRSVDIRNMLNDLGNTVITSILLVVIVLIAVLGLRTALLVGVAIPGSLLIAFLVLNSIGFTVNMVVLFALILSVGLLVDGSIVMTEFADRKMSEGKDAEEAFRLASHRMFWPITSSTATTLCAFLPLAFWPGVVGEFMKYLPITQIIVLTVALVMALIFLPTIGSIFGRRRRGADSTTARALAQGGNLEDVRGATRVYLGLLRRLIRRPYLVLLAALSLLIGAQVGYARYGQGVEFFPNVEPERAIVQIHAGGNLSAFERDRLVNEVENEVLTLAAERGEFYSLYTASRTSDDEEDIIGSITMEFTDWNLRRPAADILDDLRGRVSHLAGLRVEIEEEEGGPPGGAPIGVRLTSRSPDILPAAALKVEEAMRSVPGIVKIENNLPPAQLSLELEVDRLQAEKFGADLNLVGSYVEPLHRRAQGRQLQAGSYDRGN